MLAQAITRIIIPIKIFRPLFLVMEISAFLNINIVSFLVLILDMIPGEAKTNLKNAR